MAKKPTNPPNLESFDFTDFADEPEGKWITATDTTRNRKVELKIISLRTPRIQRMTHMTALRTIENVEQANDAAQALFDKGLSFCVIDWKGPTKDGQKLACTPSNVMRLFNTSNEIYFQVFEAVVTLGLEEADAEKKSSRGAAGDSA